MDPDAALQNAIELATEIQALEDQIGELENEEDEKQEADGEDAFDPGSVDEFRLELMSEIAEKGVELATALLDLDGWIQKGGFLPKQWRDR